MELATHKVWQLTNSADGTAPRCPAWSPDGKKIVYAREGIRGRVGRHLYSMDKDGRNDKPLLRKPRRAFGEGFLISGFASGSPEGQHILYNEIEHRGVNFKRVANRVIVVNKQGTNLKVLATPAKWLIDKVCWAEGGRAVLFAAVPNGLVHNTNIFKIYKYRLRDGQLTNLTDHPRITGVWIGHRTIARLFPQGRNAPRSGHA